MDAEIVSIVLDEGNWNYGTLTLNVVERNILDFELIVFTCKISKHIKPWLTARAVKPNIMNIAFCYDIKGIFKNHMQTDLDIFFHIT